MTPDDDEKRRIAKVIWTYTGKKQPVFEAELGYKKDRLRSMLGASTHSPPSLDELVEMAAAAGIPRAFALDGWAAADPMVQVEKRLSQLQADVEDQRRTLAEQAVLLAELRARADAASSRDADSRGRKS